MLVHIYRSNRKPDTYLYLAEKDDFSMVPDSLMTVFGEPEFSFSFQLSAQKKLIKEDATTVLNNLKEQAYHLQLRKDVLIEQMLTMKSAN
jgi:uncharacterized protein YcgL (UPF0745 family)|tara:strand:- start:4718 stop:4987 length:270 start_codon:yes stop_codon:yes gene_type:complete